jgi:hypothetical protein
MAKIPERKAPEAKRESADSGAKSTEATGTGTPEPLTQQWGMRDWNTLAARAQVSAVAWQPGLRVSGRYLGQPFTGVIKNAEPDPQDIWSLTVRFDEPVDVVESEHFSALRRQVNCTIDARGESALKTSDGVPHMVIGPL